MSLTKATFSMIDGAPVNVLDYGAVLDDSTDDTAAFQAAINAASAQGGGIVYMPAGIARVTTLTLPQGVIIEGQGGIIGASVIRGTALTGPVVNIAGRSAGLQGVQIAATTARLNSASPGLLAHGILVDSGDVPNSASISRSHLVDVFVTNQPLDGVHLIGNNELSTWDNITVADCLRHGFALDDGTRAGYTNKKIAFFVLQLRRCRVIECAGNALVAGVTGQVYQPSNLWLDHFEALGCCWDTSIREFVQQVALLNISTYALQPDIEDQQYANTTTSSTGIPRTANATPCEGILCGARNQMLMQPYFSSLIKSVEVTSSINEITIIDPVIYSGTYGTPQALGIRVQGGSAEVHFVGTTQTGATKLFQTQSAKGSIRINGIPMVPTTSSQFEGGIRNPYTPEEATIASGTLTVASLNVIVRGESGLADSLSTFRYISGINGFGGHVLRLSYGGEDITIGNAGNFLFKDGATSLLLDAAYPAATFVYNTATTKWVEQ